MMKVLKSRAVRIWRVLFLCLITSGVATSETYGQKKEKMEEGWHKETREAKVPNVNIKEWQRLGFGIFIHWSPTCIFQGCYKGLELEKDLWGEWLLNRTGMPIEEYEENLKTWNPKDFNAAEWASLIESSGARYMIYVAKHHDGFAMFDSEVNNYSLTKYTPFGRDPYKELCLEVQSRNIKTGFYYSHRVDWRNKAEEVVYPHLGELVTKYGDQYVAWFDLGAKRPMAQKCVETLRNGEKNQKIIISSRVGRGFGDFAELGDCEVPAITKEGPWETPMTLTHHWAWYPKDRGHKTGADVIQMLARIRSRGGNLLLNIGPDIRGRIPLKESLVLTTVGKWLKINGEAFFDAQATQYQDLPWGVCTQKGNTLFLHLLKRPSLDTLFLPGLNSTIKKVSLLADPSKAPLNFEKVPGGYNIDLTSQPSAYKHMNEANTVIAVECSNTIDVDSAVVLDHDLPNDFINQLATMKGGVKTTKRRFKPMYTHSGLEEPIWIEVAYKFSGDDAAMEWEFNNHQTNQYFLNLNYANLTDKPVVVEISINDQTVRASLPSTVSKVHSWDCFRVAITGRLKLTPGMNQVIRVSVAPESKAAIEGEVKILDRALPLFSIQSLSLNPAAPIKYKGYGGK